MHRAFFLLFVLSSLFYSTTDRLHFYDIPLNEEESSFGLEDLEGRLAYLDLLTADPKTGEVPQNIRVKELAFARKLNLKTKSLRKQSLTIESVGPANVGGRTRAVALDIRDENIILAGGVSGGIWKSLDGGLTWTRKSDPNTLNSVTCIAQDVRTGREDTWYYGTGELFANSAAGGGNAAYRGNGIYKSTDNGETWSVISSTEDSEPSVFNSQFQYIWAIEVNDQNLIDDELIVAAYGGILRSIDGGDTWTVEVGQELYNLTDDVNLNEINASFFTGLEKTSEGVFYASLSTTSRPDGVNSPDAGFYVSPDGDNWYPITPFTPESEYRRTVMGHAPSDPRLCYFLVNSSPTFLLRYALTGFDSDGPIGQWSTPLEVPAFGGLHGDYNAQSSYNMMVRVDPRDEDNVLIGGTNLYLSADGFRSQENIKWIGGYDPEGGSGEYLNHHPDLHDAIFIPSDPDKVLTASDGGLILTEDFLADSVEWENRNEGYLTSQFFTIAMSKESGDDFVLGGMQDNGTFISSGSSSWTDLIGGDGGFAATTAEKKLWFASFQNGQTFRLTLNDELDLTSFARVDPAGLVESSGSVYLFINPFVLDPLNSNRMFIAGGNHLYLNENVSQIPGGSQVGSNLGWKRYNDSRTSSGVVSAIDISLDGTTLYFGASNGELMKLTSANDYLSSSVEQLTSSVLPADAYVSAISINPENPEHLMVVFSNYGVPSIFESTNGGQTFTDISGFLEENADGSGNGPSIRWCEIIPRNGDILYVVGTSIGLYSTTSPNGSSTVWTQESPNLIGRAVVTMMDYRALDGRLVVATHGNGVFTTSIPDFKNIQFTQESQAFDLVSAYPNPFDSSTEIQFTIPSDGTVRVDLYTAQGAFINNLLWAPQFAGTNSVYWDGTNTSGTKLSNGIYLYRVEYNGQVKTGRLSLRD